MLLHQKRCGHEYRNLLTVLHGLERRAHSDLRLPVTDIATDEPIHRRSALHIGLHLIDAGQLIRSLDIGEGIF